MMFAVRSSAATERSVRRTHCLGHFALAETFCAQTGNKEVAHVRACLPITIEGPCAQTPRAGAEHASCIRCLQSSGICGWRIAGEDEATHRSCGGARHSVSLLHSQSYQIG